MADAGVAEIETGTVRLQVAAARQEESGRGIARMPKSAFSALGIDEGDVVEITGKRTTAAIAVPGMPVKLISLLFCYTLGLMGIISPYATGPGPIYYGSGYVSRKDFWTLGFVFGAIYLAALLVIGVPYLRYFLA